MACRRKMLGFVNWRMRVTLSDTRHLVGTFLAFDKHMNIVLGDTDEYRLVKPEGKKGKQLVEEKRELGLVILRGGTVVSLKPDSPPSTRVKPTVPKVMGSSGTTATAVPTSAPLISATGQVTPGIIRPPVVMPGGGMMPAGMMPMGFPPGGMPMMRPGMPGMPMMRPGMMPMRPGGMPMMPGGMPPQGMPPQGAGRG